MTPVSAPSTDRFATLVSLLLILIVVAVLFFLKDVFIPVALALLFSFLLAPLVTRLERWRLPRIPAVLLAVGLAFAVLAGVGYLVGMQLLDLTYKLPSYKANISQRIAAIKKSGGNSPLTTASNTITELGQQISATTGKPGAGRPDGPSSEDKRRIVPVEVIQPATSLAAVAQSVVGPVLGPLGTEASAKR